MVTKKQNSRNSGASGGAKEKKSSVYDKFDKKPAEKANTSKGRGKRDSKNGTSDGNGGVWQPTTNWKLKEEEHQKQIEREDRLEKVKGSLGDPEGKRAKAKGERLARIADKAAAKTEASAAKGKGGRAETGMGVADASWRAPEREQSWRAEDSAKGKRKSSAG